MGKAELREAHAPTPVGEGAGEGVGMRIMVHASSWRSWAGLTLAHPMINWHSASVDKSARPNGEPKSFANATGLSARSLVSLAAVGTAGRTRRCSGFERLLHSQCLIWGEVDLRVSDHSAQAGRGLKGGP